MRSMILNAEKSIDTISSLIPLYQKVQPVISQGKNIVSSLINTFKKKPNININKNVEKVDVELMPQDNNNRPFFN